MRNRAGRNASTLTAAQDDLVKHMAEVPGSSHNERKGEVYKLVREVNMLKAATARMFCRAHKVA